MAKVTPKENFLKLAGGGHPEYVPFFNMGGDEYMGEAAFKRANLTIFPNTRQPDGSGRDMWGVPYIATKETANAALPEPGNYILKDVRKWRDVIKRPLVEENIDWEAMAKADMERIKLDRTQTALGGSASFGPFMTLTNMMGLTEGMCAMFEEPEAVKELFNWIVDFFEPYNQKILDYYKPDVWNLSDDTCAEDNPFFSVAMYRDLFKPIYARMAKPAVDRGIPVLFHICGRMEDFVPEMIDFGVKYVEPAQESNDLLALKATYKGKVSIMGGFDWGKHVPRNYPNFSEEELRQDVRSAIDQYSVGGAYAFFAWPISYLGDTVIEEVKRIIRDECHFYGRKVYGYQD